MSRIQMADCGRRVKRCSLGFPCALDDVCIRVNCIMANQLVDPGSSVVIILASGSEVCEFDLGWGRWVFSERKNPEYDFLRKGSKAVGPVS